MKIRLALLVLTVAVLGILGIAATRTTEEAWIGFQKQYLTLSAQKGHAAGEPSPVEVKQDRLTGFGQDRIDRCRTCHVAIDDPRFATDAQPLKAHPDIAPHKFNEMGCTVCHEGEGRALTTELAHGKDEFWPEPLLAGKFVEASCARCHPYPYVAQTPHLKRGRELFEKIGCVGCHKVQGLSRGMLGIELTDVGAKQHRTIKFFDQKLKNPLFNVVSTLMPKFTVLSQDDIDDLAIFLKSLKGRSLAEDPMTYRARMKAFNAQTPPVVEVTAEVGKQLVDTRGCYSCHKVGEKDGKLAPDLSFLGQVRDQQYVVAHLVDPRAHTPGSNMPNFWLSNSEREAIATYLVGLNGYVKPAAPKEQYVQLCSRCHGEKGDGKGVTAENLLPRPREFTNVKFFNWLPEERAYAAIRNGVPGTAMPAFGKILDEQEAKNLFAWVRTTFIGQQREPTTPRNIPQKNPIAYSKDSWGRGQAIFAERCWGCHGRIGDGKGPNAPEMLPRPRNLMNRSFFEKLPDSRLFESITYGIVGTGMPPWDMLSDDQRWDLVNFVRHLNGTGPAASERSK
jgi:mono/diheme cytochrome c family protein